MPKKILSIGTATIDYIAVIPDDNVEKINFSNASASFLLLETGRKLEAESINWFYGGGAINAAIAMKKLNHDVDCFVKVGNDNDGAHIMQHLTSLGIGNQHVIKSQNEQTAISFMVSSHDRDPTIITYRGANTSLVIDDVPWDSIADYDAIYITNLSNQSAKIYAPLIDYAHQHNITVISNPGIRQISNVDDGFLDILAKINMFVVNRVEAEELLALYIAQHLVRSFKNLSAEDRKKPILRYGGMMVLVEDFLKALAKTGITLGVITDGKNGAYLYHHHDGFIHIPTQKVEAIGTVGAGDAFSSTLASLWLQDMDLPQAGLLAAKMAESVVKSLDAQSGLMAYDDLLQYSL